MSRSMKVLLFLGFLGCFIAFYLSETLYPPSHNVEKCGRRPERVIPQRKKRMVGGVNVEVAVWPWQVSILYKTNSSAPLRQICGGAIIHEYWIITAAACAVVDKSNLLIRAGSSRLDVDDESTQLSEVARIIRHKRFNPVTLRYNIALLKMKTPLEFNEFVHPICVPDEDAADHKYESCHITGYNDQPGDNAGVLQEAEVNIMSRSSCNRPMFWNYTVSADMLCVSEYGGGVDGCETNLGGPLSCYIKIEGSYFLIGIRVKATSCGQPNRPNVYLKVYSLYYWIEREMNISSH